LYPVPAKTSFVASEVDALRARFETHPLARNAAGFEVVLEPGDVLYLPPYTWHAVENLEPSISVNHLWHTHLRSARALPLAYFNCRVLMDQHMGTAEQFLTYFANRSLPNLHAL
jgi:Cupin-like domain